jgi:hypothetical protein
MHGMNLDGRRASGVDLNNGRTVEVHAEEERSAGVEAVGAASRQTRRRSTRRCRGGRRNVEADVEEERVPVGVW